MVHSAVIFSAAFQMPAHSGPARDVQPLGQCFLGDRKNCLPAWHPNDLQLQSPSCTEISSWDNTYKLLAQYIIFAFGKYGKILPTGQYSSTQAAKTFQVCKRLETMGGKTHRYRSLQLLSQLDLLSHYYSLLFNVNIPSSLALIQATLQPTPQSTRLLPRCRHVFASW